MLYFDLLDVRGKLAFENNQKVVYIKCQVGKQGVSLAAILPLSSGQLDNTLPIILTARLVLGMETHAFAINTCISIDLKNKSTLETKRGFVRLPQIQLLKAL